MCIYVARACTIVLNPHVCNDWMIWEICLGTIDDSYVCIIQEEGVSKSVRKVGGIAWELVKFFSSHHLR